MKSKRIDAYASTLVSLLEFAKTDDNFTVIAFASDQWAQEWTSMAFTKEDDDASRPRRRCLLVARGRGKYRCAARA